MNHANPPSSRPMTPRQQLAPIIMRWGSGMTSSMINNCRLNMEDDEFDDFILGYSKPGSHTFEDTQDQCDACNGVSIALDEVEALCQEIAREARLDMKTSVSLTILHRVKAKCINRESPEHIQKWAERQIAELTQKPPQSNQEDKR